ncbi:tRNA (5-methylaminomethyl-2-thiouridylate)-methyltransferase [Gammaproteobacteria bacterium 45_16_T64]|nr:tRNA (5-methylaminomethyl-2-thiouridylate)-methyltransferase [Gammaproteobacteria bacterium 45_16_T64]
MTTMAIQRKAIALISGGLDSLLAVKVVQEQGIHVEGVNFYTGFCVEGHTHAIRKKDEKKQKRNNALWSAETLGIKLNIVDISEEYKDIVINPQHGYGANLNPCLDCKIFMVEQANAMLNKARQLADDGGFDFIITGEVIGQRPKSQRKETMPIIARESGADDRLLRPLCAQNLPPTLAEREGWIDRDQLHGFSGRSRKPQMALAKRYGLDDYAQPAGGCCFLTDESYSKKLADLWAARGEKTYEIDDIMMLKMGRHIRPAPHYKLIVSREEGENNFLMGYRKQYPSIRITSHPGPLTLIDGTPSDEDLIYAAKIAGRFSKGRDADEMTVEITRAGGVTTTHNIKPMGVDDIKQEWYI